MKKLWRKVRKGSPARSGEASPKSGSTRGSVASLNIGYDVREKDLGKLHKAAWNGDLNKVKQLAKKDPSPLDKENRTPLHLACIQGHDQIVQELLEWKAKTNIGDNQSRTPLMRAVEFQQEGCVNLLTTYRADVETGDGQGNTPLHMAVMGGGLGIVTLLIKAGASLNTRNKEGFSPLHLAVRNKMEDVCRLLLKERADIDIEDTNLRTPLMYACQDGSVSLVRLLLGYNANTLHKDSKGWSADDYAVIPGHHACSQLITDHNHRVSRSTPQSTPRSSLPPSVVNTPRDKDSIGLPAQDAEDDDSENETISKASGGPDSWADSPEISIMDDKKGKDASDVEDDIFEEKPAAAKVDVTKFAHAIHISESDTDGESFRGPTPRKTPKDEEADDDDDQMGMPTTQGAAVAEGKRAAAAAVASARQTSWQSQTSGEDNSWGDSPVAQRKNSTQRVSFKRDEELSEVHDITVTESEAESDVHDPGAKPQVKTSTPAKPSVPSTESGYVPTGAAGSAGVSPSHEKMRGDTQKTALMDELGISDVDDISEMSDSAPALPASPPPKATNPSPGVDEWDSSAVSDIMTTPRPGILKKWGNSSLQSSGEGKQQPTSPQQKPAAQTKTLIKAPAVDSGDESSAWDTTEAENIGARSKPGPSASATAAPGPPQHKDSVSEWDSDLEDLVNPVTPAVAATPTPPPPNATITKENNANDEDADDDDWDSTTDAITPRQNAGLQYKEVNVGGPSSISEPLVPVQAAPVAQPVPESAVTASAVAAQAQGQGGGGMMAADDEDTESAWDSDGDALPSESADPPAYDDPPPPYLATPLIPTAITSPRTSQLQGAATSGQPAAQEGKVHAGVGVKAQASPAFDSDEDSETVSSWELERKRQRSKPQTSVDLNFGSRTESPNRQREIEEDAMRQEQNELQERLREQKLREEEERRKEKEEQRKREEEEEQRLRAEEVKRAREEAERKEREEAERQEQQRREWEREEMRREEE
ncbi:ankyrin repeat domain-containing protein 36B, partial [Aplysia californica]|uniref:Ankyrin repeat domain-containing protein 36B n=1 Tax=Aplysia californica TaxID=6500 RepID=A0ABM1VY73_APLCA